MKLLLVHQNSPGQYREIVHWLAAQGEHELVFLTQRNDTPPIDGVRVVQYESHHKIEKGAYALSKFWEEAAGNGYGAAVAAKQLAKEGFHPDLIVGHTGWGELTFLKQVWADVPIIGYFEYFYLAEGGLVGFDPDETVSEDCRFMMQARNVNNYVNLETVDVAMTPTQWQRDTFSKGFHEKMYVCHDGIRTERLSENPDASVYLRRLDRHVTKEDEIITFISRNMEPARGFHVFMRALPIIQKARPNARVILVGGNEVSYGAPSKHPNGFRGEMSDEVGHLIDWDRVHFVGKVPYLRLLDIIRISTCHTYLTKPFVLSWSLLESMGLGATIVASDTAPVREAITHGETGLLVDFFDHEALAEQIIDVLADPEKHEHLGPAARQHILENYDFETVCLPEHIGQMNRLLPRDKQIKIDTTLVS